MLVLSATSAQARDFCADITALASAASSNFASGVTDMTHANQGPGSCDIALTLNAPSAHICHWEFAYRAAEAAATFETFNQQIQTCLAGLSDEFKDQGVNHPDFYDLRQYQTQGAQVSLSIKDKGAMQRTFVFLRIEELP